MKKIFTLIAALFAVFAVNAEEITLSEETVSTTGWNGVGVLSDAGTELQAAGAAAGDKVAFYVSGDEGWMLQIIEGHWGPQYAQFTATDLDETGAVCIDLTQEILDAAFTQQWWGNTFILNGDGNVTCTKIALRKAGVDASEKKVIPLSFSGIEADGTCAGEWTWCQINLLESYTDETTGEYVVNYDYTDATGYDYAVVEFSNTTVPGAFKVVEDDWTTTISKDFVAGANYVAVPLSECGDWISHIGAFVIQKMSADTGIIGVTEVSYMTEKGYQQLVAKYADVVKEKDLALPTADGVISMIAGEDKAGWYAPNWIGLSNLDALYKTLVFEVESAENAYNLKVQGSEDGSTWDDNGFTTFYVEGHATPAVIALPVEGKHVNLGQYAFQNNYIVDEWMDPQTGKMVYEVGENTVVVKRVYLTSKVVECDYPGYSDGISEIKAESANSNVMYNIAGQRVNSAKGLVIMNGKKYLAK